jgi:hypothetical protein
VTEGDSRGFIAFTVIMVWFSYALCYFAYITADLLIFLVPIGGIWLAVLLVFALWLKPRNERKPKQKRKPKHD